MKPVERTAILAALAAAMFAAPSVLADTNFSFHSNIFATSITESGPRGDHKFAVPNWAMGEVTQTLGSHQVLTLEVMATAEKWTYPAVGYPLIAQIGELDANDNPYLDHQHPHSSPIMGLMLSDTILFGGGEAHQGHEGHEGETEQSLRLFFAPRGETTDGPGGYIHRTAGLPNPDAPLGHHVGQDVGHISSTLLGASLTLGSERLEATVFNGESPSPTKVDLPIAKPNSLAVRWWHRFSPSARAQISGAYVKDPEPNDPSIPFMVRTSASVNTIHTLGSWSFDNTLIAGMIRNYDHAALLGSFGDEFLFRDAEEKWNLFGRIEVLQRTPEQLEVLGPGEAELENPTQGRWLAAATLGASYPVMHAFEQGMEFRLGATGTHTFMPSEFKDTYGGDPWSAKVFLQLVTNFASGSEGHSH